jgi:hypothetical protein
MSFMASCNLGSFDMLFSSLAPFIEVPALAPGSEAVATTGLGVEVKGGVLCSLLRTATFSGGWWIGGKAELFVKLDAEA